MENFPDAKIPLVSTFKSNVIDELEGRMLYQFHLEMLQPDYEQDNVVLKNLWIA